MSNLRLVTPAMAFVPMHAPAVFTPSFQERMATLNAAIRELRAMGLKVVWSKLAGPLPQAHVCREDGVSVGQLLDRMGPLSFKAVDGCTLVSGEFMGVQVSFMQAVA